MFTGMIEEVGRIEKVRSGYGYREISVHCRSILPGIKRGDSVALDGVCQTVTEVGSTVFRVEALQTTLKKTTLGLLRPGQMLNLERAMAADGRFDGHMVQGHVEGVGKILSVRKYGLNRFITIQALACMQSRLIPEGSVAVDGISLTIAERKENTFTLNIIPETWQAVSLGKKRPGSPVNLETDLFLRYYGSLQQTISMQALNMQKMKDWGYME